MEKREEEYDECEYETHDNMDLIEEEPLPFEELRITTMTLVMRLQGTVDLGNVFFLLPITRVPLKPPKRKTQKCKIPHCEIPGSILSMRYYGHTRGIIRSSGGGFFKNSITIDISTILKNVSIKLSPTTIQMCGAASEENGCEGAEHIINHIMRVQKILENMADDPEITQTTLQWVKEVTRGEATMRKNDSLIERHNISLYVIAEKEDYLLAQPDIIPEGVDIELASFFLEFLAEFVYHSDYCNRLDWITTLKSVVSEHLQITRVHKAMVNYNFSLGFPIDRHELDICFKNTDGFYSFYDNALAHAVSIVLPYTPVEGSFNRKKDKTPHLTFLIYRSGLITLSGPGEPIMKDAYYRFLRIVSQNRHKIEDRSAQVY